MTPIDREDRGEGDPQRALAAEQDAVGAEAGVAGERAPGEELAEIRGEAADQPREQRRIALEDVLVDRARRSQRGDDEDDRERRRRAARRA